MVDCFEPLPVLVIRITDPQAFETGIARTELTERTSGPNVLTGFPHRGAEPHESVKTLGGNGRNPNSCAIRTWKGPDTNAGPC